MNPTPKPPKTWEVTKREDFPQVEHYAILEFDSVAASDGWDGTYHHPTIRYTVYTDKQDWESAVDIMTRFPERSHGKSGFKAIHVRPASVRTVVEVEVP